MTIRIVKEPEGAGPPYERCCFCWRPTTYWHAKKDVAVCPECASTHATPDIPKKQDWCKQTAGLDQMTDPTPQTTPTRDEAVPTGWKLVPIDPTHNMACVAGEHANITKEDAKRVYAAMLASAPAPASGRVDAVAEIRRAASALINNLWVGVYSGSRTFEENWRVFERDYPGVKWLHDALKAPDLSPAATPVSEAGGDMIPRAKNVGRYLAETNEGRLLYLNHATEWHEMPNILAKPASSPAGGDVDLIRNLVIPMVRERSREPGDAWHQAEQVLVTLSQSTSVGRVGE